MPRRWLAGGFLALAVATGLVAVVRHTQGTVIVPRLPLSPRPFGTVTLPSDLPELHARVRLHGADYSSDIPINYPTPDFRTIVQESDTIVVGVIGSAVPVLTHDGAVLETDYQISVRQVARRAAQPAITRGSRLIVRRPGGNTVMDGFDVRMADPDFPPFETGAVYVLFLTREPNEPHARLRYGGQSAFRVGADGTVRQASLARGRWNQERGAVSLSAFLEAVDRVVAPGVC